MGFISFLRDVDYLTAVEDETVGGERTRCYFERSAMVMRQEIASDYWIGGLLRLKLVN